MVILTRPSTFGTHSVPATFRGRTKAQGNRRPYSDAEELNGAEALVVGFTGMLPDFAIGRLLNNVDSGLTLAEWTGPG